MQERSYGHLRILSLKGSDIYCRINEKVGNGQLSVCKENGKIDFELFNGFIDESLDTDYIENIYSDYKDTLLSKKFRAKKEYLKLQSGKKDRESVSNLCPLFLISSASVSKEWSFRPRSQLHPPHNLRKLRKIY